MIDQPIGRSAHPFHTRWRIISIAGVLFIAATGVAAAVGHVVLSHVDAGEASADFSDNATLIDVSRARSCSTIAEPLIG
ncbi:hypothetical protein ACK2ER_00230 [Corynebacterium diphtheriae]|uniref:hypothetical protein n=1 Tax=Corynebacterium diphtheriae TaxID=1717 RepID=UPI0011CE6328|nr:hypothetical protein [Corynebacterium diphtheriae]MBG9281563.1 hypothetical protein [Corynebacterium diphtheriae bv. mitis]MCM0079521.1 hypothetical protein [Corynebacterium diphtheriae]UJL54341.1 hypothetical protein FE380_09190 [Corynebacterium diphtheriae]